MPRGRSPNREKAYNLWLQSDGKLELKRIADELEVSAEQIRKWKNQDRWDTNLNSNVTKQNRKLNSNVTNQKGAPKGNKNAKGNSGGSAPKGNKNNLRHGLYSLLNTNALSEEEKETIMSSQELDTIKELENQVRLCDILISRHLNKIAELKSGKEVSSTNISKKVTKFNSKTSAYTQEETEQSYVYVDEKIDKLNESLAKQIKIRGKLLKDIENIKNSRKKVDVDMINRDLVDDWVRGVCGSE